VYYDRYPVLPNGKGDDAGRPAVYFHRLGEPQDQDKLVYNQGKGPPQVEKLLPPPEIPLPRPAPSGEAASATPA